MNTTRKESEKILNNIIKKNSELGIELSNEDLSKEFKKQFKIRNRNRVNTIAQTEVQNVSEFSKLTEAQILQDKNVIKSMKRWDAILDRRTRPHHARADGQRRELNEPFIVKGERLNRPGDSSLGASKDNVINCRCSVQYIYIQV